MTITQLQQLLVKIVAGICIAILVILPFHAFLTVWAASVLGHYTTFRLWKEVLLAVAAVLTIFILMGDRELRRKLFADKLMQLIGIYAVLIFASGAIAYFAKGVSGVAALDGVLLDVRFLAFFVVTWVLTRKNSVLYMNWRKLLIGPAAVVMMFGLLQRFALPYDVLKHFGYGPDTIDPYETVDQKRAFLRIQSTLRGANILGAYLVVIVTAIATLVTRVKPRLGKLVWFAIGLAGLLVLFLTYSRSAWIGTIISVGILVALGLRHRPHLWRLSFLGLVLVALAFAGALLAFRDNDTVQNTFFHTDEHSRSSESSNSGHVQAVRNGWKDVNTYPLGTGAGTAGPASVHNDLGAPRIAENYFVQIAQEGGLIALGLFLAINALVAVRLSRREYDSLARVLLASLIGISVIGMFSHVWTDDTLAYIWWGFAGVAIARLKERRVPSEEV